MVSLSFSLLVLLPPASTPKAISLPAYLRRSCGLLLQILEFFFGLGWHKDPKLFTSGTVDVKVLTETEKTDSTEVYGQCMKRLGKTLRQLTDKLDQLNEQDEGKGGLWAEMAQRWHKALKLVDSLHRATRIRTANTVARFLQLNN